MTIRRDAHRLLGSLISLGRAIDRKHFEVAERKAHRSLDALIDLIVTIRHKRDDVAMSLNLTVDPEVPKERK